ncbi:hypothetical protein [Novipirellula artificiosorum]|uniref:Uncharacterized protein n=1 Tax=Novipirellula artificiosorum TaxID=2528016 RepID=A0A5C6D526_9BACT|nr:hypothetical protein [Novipirellula artificiosorum]TWU32042.1 hypothetical protein Poly41_59300 [Novipirellula artificiosorum]
MNLSVNFRLSVGASILLLYLQTPLQSQQTDVRDNFSRHQLVAWCIVPFDGKKRGPAERAAMLKTIHHSTYAGPIGIIGHTQDDVEQRLRDNLDGLDWIVPQLSGKPAGEKPKPNWIKE